MAGRIVKEVLEHAPIDLTPLQMLVLVSLAEDARENTRIARYETSVLDLQRRTRSTSGTIRNALGELSRRGLIKPLHKARIGIVQNYYVSPMDEHTRHATNTPGGVRSVTHE